jgi:hypothetical protein
MIDDLDFKAPVDFERKRSFADRCGPFWGTAARQSFLCAESPRNPLKRPVSDERIQGNPRKYKSTWSIEKGLFRGGPSNSKIEVKYSSAKLI